MIAIDDRRGQDAPPTQLNLAQYVLQGADVHDDAIALEVLHRDSSETWTYGELRAAAMRVAGGLHAAGLKPGARLLMRIGNTPEFPIVFLGAIAAGILPVPTSAALGVDEITKLCNALSPAAVIATPGIPLPKNNLPAHDAATLLGAAPASEYVCTKANDPAYIVFTSGTAAAPTGVVHAHRAIWARRAMIRDWSALTPTDRILHAGAFNWTYTLGTGLMDPWSIGATALVLGQDTEIDALPALAAQHEATILAGAPGVFRRLLRSSLPPLPYLRHALSAGEKLPETLRTAWKNATNTDIHEAFGQSECSTFISGAPHRPAPANSMGYVQSDRAVAVLGNDEPTTRGSPGRIAVHKSDPGLMLGYLEAPIATEDWIATGDLGVMRDDGAIEYHGRADDLLTSGGFRVSPLEVETTMNTHATITESAAVDIEIAPDTRVIALYYTSDTPIDGDALHAYAAAHLAKHKRPRLFRRLDKLPRNPNGKLLRKALRAANEDTS